MIIYAINRTDRPERRKHLMNQLSIQGLDMRLYPAKIDKIGWHGCRDSHLTCLANIHANQEMGMILEDDVKFLHGMAVVYKAIEELPVLWDALYLGASPQSPQEKYSEHLFRLTNAWCMHAILWNPREGGAVDAILKADVRHEIGKIDVFVSERIMPYYNVFVCCPMVATQEQFQSDTCHRSDVSTIAKNYAKYCV